MRSRTSQFTVIGLLAMAELLAGCGGGSGGESSGVGLAGPGDSDSCQSRGLSVPYVAGMYNLKIQNYSDVNFDLSLFQTSSSQKPLADQVFAVPGYPSYVAPDSTLSTLVKFTLTYQSGAYSYGFALKSQTLSVTLAQQQIGNPGPVEHTSFWDTLKNGLELLKGIALASEGDLAAFGDIAVAAYEIINGDVDGAGNGNQMSGGSYALNSTITADIGGAPLTSEPELCSGDIVALSDGVQYTVEMTVVRNSAAIPEVQLTIYPYATAMAIRSLQQLDAWRQSTTSTTPAVHQYLAPPYLTIMSAVFDDPLDLSNHALCPADGRSSSNSFLVMSRFDPTTAYNFWNFANHLDTKTGEIEQWAALFPCSKSPAAKVRGH